MPELDKKKLKHLFQQADLNKNGTIEKSELLRLMGVEEGSTFAIAVETLFDEADTNRDGTVDLEEFEQLIDTLL